MTMSTLSIESPPQPERPVRVSCNSLFSVRLMIAAMLLAGLGIVALFVITTWESPAGPAQGHQFSGTAPLLESVPRRFTVATFNIHGGYGEDGRLDLRRTADLLQGVDLVGLNEVRGGTRSDPRNQAEQLGEILDFRWLFAPTETIWSGPHFGQGILSRLPVTGWQRIPLPRVNGNGYRNYVECQIPLVRDDRTDQLTVLVVHLDRKTDRQEQLRIVIRRFLEVPSPAVLMGDFNAKRTEPQLMQLAAHPEVTDCFGKHATGDTVRRRIDWIFSRGLRCVAATLAPNDASDHPCGRAIFEW